jgi:hypothetical protein
MEKNAFWQSVAEKSKQYTQEFDKNLKEYSGQTWQWVNKQSKMFYLKSKIKFKQHYYIEKALAHHASKNLPFTTLCALGEKLSDKRTYFKTKQIIEQNEISFQGKVYKLSDPKYQGKVREAVKQIGEKQQQVELKDVKQAA